MRTIHRFFLKYSNKILGFLLIVLGFSAVCTEVGCEYGSLVEEYGAPYATFIVRGKAVSIATDQAIPSIRVVMTYDTSYTDQDGNYQVENGAFPNTDSFLIEFADVDGQQNGLYYALDTTLIFTDPQFTGGDGHWNKGETEKELQIRMRTQD